MKIDQGFNTLLRHERSFSFFKDSLKQIFSLDKIAQTDTRMANFYKNSQNIFHLQIPSELMVIHMGEYLVKPSNLSNDYLN